MLTKGILVLWSLLLFTARLSSAAIDSDALSLLALKSAISSDPHRVLQSWSGSDTDSCGWLGVTCTGRRVTGLNLSGCQLQGYIPSELGALVYLQNLSLSHNNFSQVIPVGLFAATPLLSLDLSHNSLTGGIPAEIESLQNLTHLDFSSNFLGGSLPLTLTKLRSLSGILNLSYNQFSGEVPASYGDFPVMVSLDIGHNNLTGKIPQAASLLNQGPTAFIGNPNLCGFPLQTPCAEARLTPLETPARGKGRRKTAMLAVSLTMGASTVITGVSFLAWRFRKKTKDRNPEEEEENDGKEGKGGKEGKFVVLGEEFNLELEDLLRASAYMVAKGRRGIVYRVVVGAAPGLRPRVMTVRRLSEGEGTWRLKEFQSEAEAIARVSHPNLVPLRAYYYADDEKLLIYDFISTLTLHNALHGGSSSIGPLSWPARLRIVRGIAKGLMYIHESGSRKYVHGSLKSSKILLADDLQPYIADLGLDRLFSLANAASFRKPNSSKVPQTSSPSAYLAPEARIHGNKLTQKCDVYSFGVVLLEIVIGRPPDSQIIDDLRSLGRKMTSEERSLFEIIEINVDEALAAIRVALTCTESDPELRPKMRFVSENLDRIGK